MTRGVVHGLVGANGAGKTTLIKHILGLLRAESGSVHVFGLDPVVDPVAVLSRIGYLPEEKDLPGWMRVDELIRYSRTFYPAWDDVYAEELRHTFALDPTATIRNLSKGQKARAALLITLAYRPELLDEPSSGLDPIVRRDILAAVIRTIAELEFCARGGRAPELDIHIFPGSVQLRPCVHVEAARAKSVHRHERPRSRRPGGVDYSPRFHS